LALACLGSTLPVFAHLLKPSDMVSCLHAFNDPRYGISRDVVKAIEERLPVLERTKFQIGEGFGHCAAHPTLHSLESLRKLLLYDANAAVRRLLRSLCFSARPFKLPGTRFCCIPYRRPPCTKLPVLCAMGYDPSNWCPNSSPRCRRRGTAVTTPDLGP
jgi:hypothetical protein